PLRRRRIVGRGRRDEEVEAVEDARDPRDQLAARALVLAPPARRDLLRRADALHEPAREIGLALRAERRDAAADLPGADQPPVDAEIRRPAADLLDGAAELLEGARGAGDDGRDLGVDDGVTEVGRVGDAQAGREWPADGVEVGAARRRQAARIARVRPGEEIEEEGRVLDGLGERAVDAGAAVVPARDRSLGHAAERGLEPEGA